ncbi:hypothetical protein [Methylobacterium iners]|nr:hypothetical protein [Methylobacterium iners]
MQQQDLTREWVMTATRLLSSDEFSACFSAPMRNVTATAEAVVDVWSYVETIALPLGRATEILDVTSVYRDAAGRFDQVLIGTDISNLFLAVVVNRADRNIRGHHLLDLAEKYGVSRN